MRFYQWGLPDGAARLEMTHDITVKPGLELLVDIDEQSQARETIPLIQVCNLAAQPSASADDSKKSKEKEKGMTLVPLVCLTYLVCTGPVFFVVVNDESKPSRGINSPWVTTVTSLPAR